MDTSGCIASPKYPQECEDRHSVRRCWVFRIIFWKRASQQRTAGHDARDHNHVVSRSERNCNSVEDLSKCGFTCGVGLDVHRAR